MKDLIIIVGPTAVGKTELSIKIAKELNGEIISCDSMQLYKYMNIGTAKPSQEEIKDIKHYLIDEIDPKKEFSVSDYSIMAKTYINDIMSRGKVPIIVGGTGLYANSLIYDMDFASVTEDKEYRAELELLLKEHGKLYLYEMLKSKDPSAAEKIHFNNVKKVIRSLEIIKVNGSKGTDFSDLNKLSSDYNIILLGLTRNRKKLYARINKRVDIMLNSGLIDEVKFLKNIGLSELNRSMQGIGYKEVLMYLDDKIDYETLTSMIKQNSRRYAKRQITWFKRYKFLKWFDLDELKSIENASNSILQYIRTFHNVSK
ncbi:tRNA (adenosine(37)-N6)-dimethylallyltransferase MiaA [Helicovermis profundi]|uniref:tRNA dimethylallyltransferase n=1 Tax=Helicovermis profundi TaxID=3065157 RepID=A0AAU9E3G2_9FIRM|nr:tRNA (adenosine(37)-N6)-dimethylallyltransferase MiaA [Clostridia bacterium S502]